MEILHLMRDKFMEHSTNTGSSDGDRQYLYQMKRNKRW